MTEPQAGADPGEFTCKAHLDGDEWVIDGEKWFASHACIAEFLIVMVITDPDVPVHEGSTMLIVPHDTPGLETVRNTAVGPKDEIGSGVHRSVERRVGKECVCPCRYRRRTHK